MTYEYPGNVRELENIAQRLLLPGHASVRAPVNMQHELYPDYFTDVQQEEDAWISLEENEKRYIVQVLDEVEGNKSQAAKILKIDRVSLWRKIKRYGLDKAEE